MIIAVINLVCLYLGVLYLDHLHENKKEIIPYSTVLVGVYCAAFILSLFVYYQANTSDRNPRLVNYKLNMIDNTIVTTDSINFLVGQTKGYLFIYDASKKSTRIIVRSNIKEMIAYKVKK